jgi:hypothetical protein
VSICEMECPEANRKHSRSRSSQLNNKEDLSAWIYESGNFDLSRELALPHKSPSWDDNRFAITGQRLTLRQSQSGSWDELEPVPSCRGR